MLKLLKFWLEIYTWKEFWMAVSVPLLLVGSWFLFSFMLTIQNDIIRTVSIWSFLSLLSMGASLVDYVKKRKD